MLRAFLCDRIIHDSGRCYFPLKENSAIVRVHSAVFCGARNISFYSPMNVKRK